MDAKLELLRRVPLFSQLKGSGLEAVGRLADEIDIAPGRELTKQGDFAHEFFLIVDGTVRIERNGQVLTQLGPGDFLGEIALIDGGTRSATAITETPARLLVLGHREFNSLIDEFPAIRTAVLQALAERVRRLEPDAPG